VEKDYVLQYSFQVAALDGRWRRCCSSICRDCDCIRHVESVHSRRRLCGNRHSASVSSKRSSGTTSTNAIYQRTTQIVDFINSVTLSGRELAYVRSSDDTPKLNDDEAVEVVALHWLIQTDPLRLAAPQTDSEKLFLQQRYALATLWAKPTQHFAPYRGGDLGRHVCEWDGITCHNSTGGTDLGHVRRVTHIQLSRSNWNGRLSPDLGLLSSLVSIDLSDNFLTGSLPDSLHAWTHLQHFDISNNALTGYLPTCLGQWTSIQYFSVRGNSADGTASSGLTGRLPEGMGQNWSEIRHLDLSWNALVFSLWPYYITRWTKLEYFNADDNGVTGALPDDGSLAQWTNLRFFSMAANDLTGAIPTDVGQWTSLEYFNVSANSLTGTLPIVVGQWTRLKSLNVASNSLTGTLSGQALAQWTAMEMFDIQNNRFSGQVPESMVQWTSLQQALLSFNALEGSIPPAICSTAVNLTALCSDVVCPCRATVCECLV
jgi:Leucine rich repeat